MITLHLVRKDHRPAAIALRDWIVDLDRRELAGHGVPPRPPGTVTDDELIQLIFAADRVITW